jgi:hypothetical protein
MERAGASFRPKVQIVSMYRKTVIDISKQFKLRQQNQISLSSATTGLSRNRSLADIGSVRMIDD